MTLWIHEDESLQALAQQDALLHAWLSVSRQRQASGLEDPEALAIEALADMTRARLAAMAYASQAVARSLPLPVIVTTDQRLADLAADPTLYGPTRRAVAQAEAQNAETRFLPRPP